MSIPPFMPLRLTGERNHISDVCESYTHVGRVKPPAKYYHTTAGVWPCACCASTENRRAVERGVKAMCIPAAERTFQLLISQ